MKRPPQREAKAFYRTRLIWEVSINGRNKAARVFVVLGTVVPSLALRFHCFAGYSKVLVPALAASNLAPELQAALRVVFLSLGWHWFVTAIVALLAGITETRLRKILVLFCGLAVLLEAGVGASMMGFFIGNEMIGAAALLLVCGGLLFEELGAQTCGNRFQRTSSPQRGERMPIACPERSRRGGNHGVRGIKRTSPEGAERKRSLKELLHPEQIPVRAQPNSRVHPQGRRIGPK